jgi:hypothetical protein
MALFTLDDIGTPVPVDDSRHIFAYPVAIGRPEPGHVLFNAAQALQTGLPTGLHPQWVVDELNARAHRGRSRGVVDTDLMTGTLEVRTPGSSAEAADWLAARGHG